jgi:hypothetical protein
LDLPLPGAGQRDSAHSDREAAKSRPRHRLEGAVQLCTRYRWLVTTGKKTLVVIAAIGREMPAFLWAIGRQVEPLT